MKSSMHKIFIQQLKVNTIIGVMPYERVIKQTVFLDLELFYDFSEAAKADELSKTINYAKLCEQVAQFCAQSSFELVETLADNLGNFILQNFPAQQINLTVHKPFAVKNTSSVGVSISKAR